MKPTCAATFDRYAFAEGRITYGSNVEQSGGSAAGFGRLLPLESAYLFVPLLIWMALRYGPPGVAIAIAGVLLITLWGTAEGAGPFVWGTLRASLLTAQAFIGIAAMTSLLLAATVTERRRTAAERAFLAEASGLLVGSLDYATTLTQAAQLAVRVLADRGVIDRQEAGGTLRRLAAPHTDPTKEALLREMQRRYPLGPVRPYAILAVLYTSRSRR